MTQTFSDHLRGAARDYFARDAHPVVAWDCLAAKAWGYKCMDWAEQFEGLDLIEGANKLTAIRDGARTQDGGLGFFVGLDVWREITKLTDPFLKEPVGFIRVMGVNSLAFNDHGHGAQEIGKDPEGYTRFYSVNTSLSSIRKGRKRGHGPFGWDHDEDPQAWAARKAAWFGRYAPDLPVIAERTMAPSPYEFFPILGRAGDFAEAA